MKCTLPSGDEPRQPFQANAIFRLCSSHEAYQGSHLLPRHWWLTCRDNSFPQPRDANVRSERIDQLRNVQSALWYTIAVGGQLKDSFCLPHKTCRCLDRPKIQASAQPALLGRVTSTRSFDSTGEHICDRLSLSDQAHIPCKSFILQKSLFGISNHGIPVHSFDTFYSM